MINVYLQKNAKILRVERENENTSTLVLKLPNQATFSFRPGQFMMVGLPGFGECPISISSAPRESDKNLALTIRGAGELTNKLVAMKKGDSVLVRGPFGNGFPEITGNLVLIGGGCGIAPLMAVYEEYKNKKDVSMKFLMGCKNESSLIFSKQIPEMRKHGSLSITLDQKRFLSRGFKSGPVVELAKNTVLPVDAKFFICGPTIMYPKIAKVLLKKKIDPKNIFMSLAKRMHCGVGVCEHCAIGTKYVCKDGPVFSYDFLQQFDKYKAEI